MTGNSCSGRRSNSWLRGDKPAKSYPAKLPSRKIFLFQNPAMMQFMPCDDISESADADFILVCSTAPSPRRFVEMAQQGEGGPAYSDKVFHQIAQRTMREWAIANVVVLLEALHRGGIGARDAERAVGENALGIAHVPQDFFGAPFLRRVAEVTVFLIASGKQHHGLAALLIERAENVLSLDQRNVAAIVRRILAWLGTSDGKSWRTDHGWFQHRLAP